MHRGHGSVLEVGVSGPGPWDRRRPFCKAHQHFWKAARAEQGAANSRDVIFKPSTWDQIPFGVMRALISGCYCTPARQCILEDQTRKTCASRHSLWLTNDNPTKIYTTCQQPSTEPPKPVQCQHLQRKRFRSPSATTFLLMPTPFDFFPCFCDAGAACEN
jgi:hypothetical protein